MKIGLVKCVVAVSVIGGVSALGLAGSPVVQRQAAAPAKVITPVQAMKIAVAKTGGRAVSATFEFDEGHWIYGVIVARGKTLQEVELDPSSGKVGDVEKITPEGEGKEMVSELNKAIGKSTK